MMLHLVNKKIILGITGSIAAYKTPQLVRLLVKEGADVQVIMTENAKDFVTPLTLSTVSQKTVLDTLQENGQWNNHVLLGLSADLFLIAPCSANTLAKMAHGLCDNLLLSVYLSAKCPVVIAPAMDEDMWHHPATKSNIAVLQSFGHTFIPVGKGELASGLTGEGRMAEPENILQWVEKKLTNDFRLQAKGEKRALVTAGATREAIDPVRFLTNHSTGKMGGAMALALAERGYHVDFVAGQGVQTPVHNLIQIHSIISAQEMFEQCNKLFANVDIAVMAAAVADYRPENISLQKIKKSKSGNSLNLKLIENPDILAHLGTVKKKNQILVGFALESENELENALKKVTSKKADFIILNSLNDPGAGFGADTNKVTILSSKGKRYALPLQSKRETAKAIVSRILS